MKKHTPMIGSYSFGEITIEGTAYTNDVIIYPDRVKPNWWREQGHSLCKDDVQDVLDAKPDVLIIGQGAYSRMRVPGKVQDLITSNEIELIIESTKKAWQTYNSLREKRETVAALHLTC